MCMHKRCTIHAHDAPNAPAAPASPNRQASPGVFIQIASEICRNQKKK